MPIASGFSVLFERAQRGDWNALYDLTFCRLRSIASALLRGERCNHPLQPADLVGELFLKFQRPGIRVLDEKHFFALSARAMRQVLIDHGRNQASARQFAPEWAQQLLLEPRHSDTDPESVLTIRAVFRRLEALDPVAARTVWLRAVEGLTLAELSEAQAREVWRVRADYEFGVQWMADRVVRPTSGSHEAKFPDQPHISIGGLPE